MIILICLPFFSAYAQKTTLTYLIFNRPLPHSVEIRLIPPHEQPFSPSFTFVSPSTLALHIRPGEYTLQIILENQVIEKSIVVEIQPSLTISIDLPENIHGHGEVIVLGESTTEALRRPVVSHVIRSRVVQELAQTRSTHIQDVLAETTPGVIRSHDDIAHVRGYEMSIGYNFNGTSLLGALNPIFGLGPDPNVFEWLQLRTGAYPARYGWRFSGHMEVVPYSGIGYTKPELRVDIGTGTQSTYRAGASVRFGKTDWGLFLSGKVESTQQYFQPRSRTIFHDKGKIGRFFLRWDRQWSSSWQTGMSFFFNTGDIEVPEDPEMVQAFQSLQIREIGTLIETTYTGSRTQIQFNLSGYLQKESLYVQSISTSEEGEFASRHDRAFGLDIMVTHSLSSVAEVEWGVQHRKLLWNEWLDTGPFPGVEENSSSMNMMKTQSMPPMVPAVVDTPWKDSGTLLAGYFDTHWNLWNRLHINLGVRYDTFHLITQNSYISPRVNLLYRFQNSPFALLASYNRLVWAPPIENYLISSLSSGSRPLRPALSNVYEGGLRFAQARWLFQMNAYYRISKDIFHTMQDKPRYWFPFLNFDKELMYGLEFSLRGRIKKRLDFGLNYTLSYQYFYNPMTGGYMSAMSNPHDTSRFLAPMDQRHTLNGWVSTSFRDRATFTLSGTWASGLPAQPMKHMMGSMNMGSMKAYTTMDMTSTAPSEERMPSYLYLNAHISWKITKSPILKLHLSIENIFNTRVPITQSSLFTPSQYISERKILFTFEFSTR